MMSKERFIAAVVIAVLVMAVLVVQTLILIALGIGYPWLSIAGVITAPLILFPSAEYMKRRWK